MSAVDKFSREFYRIIIFIQMQVSKGEFSNGAVFTSMCGQLSRRDLKGFWERKLLGSIVSGGKFSAFPVQYLR